MTKKNMNIVLFVLRRTASPPPRKPIADCNNIFNWILAWHHCRIEYTMYDVRWWERTRLANIQYFNGSCLHSHIFLSLFIFVFYCFNVPCPVSSTHTHTMVPRFHICILFQISFEIRAIHMDVIWGLLSLKSVSWASFVPIYMKK